MALGKSLRAIDFFCGAGGMTYGLSKAGIKVIAGVDIDESCKDTYELNNKDSKFILADIRKLTVKKLANQTKIKKNDDDLVFIACSPCQYWTQLRTNKTKSSKTKNLLESFRKHVKYFLPGYIFMENVPGILRNGKESKLQEFIGFLESNGYAVDGKVVNTSYYGVPQTRKRFVLVASRVDKSVSIPKEDRKNIATLRNFIGTHNGFPLLKHANADVSKKLNVTARLSDVNLRRLKATPHNGGTRLAWKNNKDLQLKTYIGKDDTFTDTYGRLHWDKPAPTMTTKFYSISNGRFAHPVEDRGLSLREGATLQTFPKSYIFKGESMVCIARQIGNAVPPVFAKKIASAFKRRFV